MLMRRYRYRRRLVFGTFIAACIGAVLTLLWTGLKWLVLFVYLPMSSPEPERLSVGSLESEIGAIIFDKLNVDEVRGINFEPKSSFGMTVYVFETDESSVRRLAQERGLEPLEDMHPVSFQLSSLPDDWPRPHFPMQQGFGYNAQLGYGDADKAGFRREYLYYDKEQGMAFYRLH